MVITYGSVALDGVMRHLTLNPTARPITVLAAPHPSPANGRNHLEKYARSVQALRLASTI